MVTYNNKPFKPKIITSVMNDTLWLSQETKRYLEDLTRCNEKIEGVLLYCRWGNQHENCVVEDPFVLGIGNESEIGEIPEAEIILSEFLKRKHEYRPALFLTHPQWAASQYGQDYLKKPSEKDKERIVARMSSFKDINMMSLIIAPETKLVYGIDRPELKYLKFETPTHRSRVEGLRRTLEQLKKEMNITINYPPLTA